MHLSFLHVDDQPISLEKVVKYLQFSGKLGHFIGDILSHYVIEQELKKRKILVSVLQ